MTQQYPTQQYPTKQPEWTGGWRPSTPTPPVNKRPSWLRRNLATVLAGSALAVSLVGLVTPVDAVGPQGPQGVQGERGPAGPAGKNGKDAPAAQQPAAAPAPAPAPAPEAAPKIGGTIGAPFAEGVYQVGVDIQPGLYKATVHEGEFGYWARLSSETTSDIIANDAKESGTMYLRVKASDKYVEISGVIFHKVS
jgi:pyruvate/2-oxoglutarate dehydrogenase complex dihydrolipoamide acyltransferase (E2) component